MQRESKMKDNYYDLITVSENVHRSFLDVLKFEINKLKIKDISNVQAVLLYNIGDRTLRVGDLINLGCYFGTNVSYNLRNLVENGYLLQEPQKHDRRSTEVKQTKKGLELSEKLDHIFDIQAKFLQEKGINEDKMKDLILTLSSLERNLRNK
jgi:DNA-binding MarR family transcriptional regulator